MSRLRDAFSRAIDRRTTTAVPNRYTAVGSYLKIKSGARPSLRIPLIANQIERAKTHYREFN